MFKGIVDFEGKWLKTAWLYCWKHGSRHKWKKHAKTCDGRHAFFEWYFLRSMPW